MIRPQNPDVTTGDSISLSLPMVTEKTTDDSRGVPVVSVIPVVTSTRTVVFAGKSPSGTNVSNVEMEAEKQ